MTSEVQAAAVAGSAAPEREAPSAAAGTRATGSAREGAEHWWQERLSAIAALLLWVWFAVSLLRLPSYDQGLIAEWLSSPLAAVPMLLLIVTTFWHIRLGLQVIVDDYVHDEGSKLFATVIVAFGSVLGAAFALFSVLKLALGGGD